MAVLRQAALMQENSLMTLVLPKAAHTTAHARAHIKHTLSVAAYEEGTLIISYCFRRTNERRPLYLLYCVQFPELFLDIYICATAVFFFDRTSILMFDTLSHDMLFVKTERKMQVTNYTSL